MGPRFLALSTGRAGSRYLAKLLNDVGVPTLHEKHGDLSEWNGSPALGEVSAWFVTQTEKAPDARVWHFSRHPQPFVTSLVKFGFWGMNHPSIHPYLRRSGDQIADSFLYWVDWNRRILEVPHPRRTTFRIEGLCSDLLWLLADSVGVDADTAGVVPAWNEAQDFAPIPADVAGEVGGMMEVLGYA